MWHNMLKEVMEDVDQLDDTVFTEDEEEDEDLNNRNGVPEAVDCYGLPMLISKALRFLFRTDRKETVNTRYFLSTRSVFAVCRHVLVKTQLPDTCLCPLLGNKYSDASANEDNSFRNHIR